MFRNHILGRFICMTMMHRIWLWICVSLEVEYDESTKCLNEIHCNSPSRGNTSWVQPRDVASGDLGFGTSIVEPACPRRGGHLQSGKLHPSPSLPFPSLSVARPSPTFQYALCFSFCFCRNSRRPTGEQQQHCDCPCSHAMRCECARRHGWQANVTSARVALASG